MAIPWARLIRYTPQLIAISRELLQKAQREPEPAAVPARTTGVDGARLQARVAALEENERRQAELVERMAEQQADLARAVFTLHQRERWLIGALAVLGVAVLALLVWQALR